MGDFAQPTKEQVRCYLMQRQSGHKALPPIEEIRRQLGWKLCVDPAARKARR